MMPEQIKNHGLIHIFWHPYNKYDDFIVVEAIEVEDQKAIKIDDYSENILPFSSAGPCSPPNMHKKLLFSLFFLRGDIFSYDQGRKAIKDPSSGSLISLKYFIV